MFSSLEIGQAPGFTKYLNQYDVIHLDIQWCMEPAGGPENVVSYITEKTILELRNYYPEILPDSIKSLPEALSCINTATGQKFVVIIDGMGLFYPRCLYRPGSPRGIHQLSPRYDSKVLNLPNIFNWLTSPGFFQSKKIKTQSALNNFAEFTMTDARIFSRYIGFTEEEVRMLCEKYHRDFSKTKHWYDGYLLEQYQVYNPKAVVELMIWNKFQSYWSDTGTYEAIVPLINMDFDGLKTAIIENVVR